MEEKNPTAIPPDPGLISLAATSEGSAGPASRLRDALAPGSLLAGRYRIERFLARGGMGEVHQAHYQLLDVTLALKTLRFDLEGDPVRPRTLKPQDQTPATIGHQHAERDVRSLDSAPQPAIVGVLTTSSARVSKDREP